MKTDQLYHNEENSTFTYRCKPWLDDPYYTGKSLTSYIFLFLFLQELAYWLFHLVFPTVHH